MCSSPCWRSRRRCSPYGRRRTIASLAAGDVGARTRSFRRAIVLGLVDVAVILVLFAVAGRPVEGLVRLDWLPQGWWTGAAWGVVLLVCPPDRPGGCDSGKRDRALRRAKEMTSVEGILPHTPGELSCSSRSRSRRGWARRSSSGAICGLFHALVGPMAAVLASTLMFGLGHAYQGAPGIVRTGIVGLLFAGGVRGDRQSPGADAAARGDPRDQRDGRVSRAQPNFTRRSERTVTVATTWTFRSSSSGPIDCRGSAKSLSISDS